MTERMAFLEGSDVYTIASQELEAAVSPEMGGRVLSMRYRREIDILIPMTPHRFGILNWPRAGAYPLFPYHNRLAGARVRAGGNVVDLAAHPAALPHTLHGQAHGRPWQVELHLDDRIVMRLDYHADADWPWDFVATQEFRAEGATLVADFSLTNLSSSPMPGGIGWHPYFASTVQPRTDAGFLWPHDNDYLPTGIREKISDRIEQERQPTSYLEDWAFVEITSDANTITTMSASSPFDYLVVHRGDPSHVCVEPVTHVANAWNLDAGASDVGARLLHQGQRMEGTVTLSVSS